MAVVDRSRATGWGILYLRLPTKVNGLGARWAGHTGHLVGAARGGVAPERPGLRACSRSARGPHLGTTSTYLR